MKAKELPRIRLEGRTKLEEVIPLDTPIHIFIDPSAACNFKCGFCFHAAGKAKHHEIMNIGMFMNVIDDLKEFPHKLKAIRLYGFGEPLLNARLPLMVLYTKVAEVTDFVEFTTNGWWLSPELNESLIAAGLDAITISVPGLNDEEIQKACGKRVNFQKYYNHIADFYSRKGNCRVHIKITNLNLTEERKFQFHSLFGGICDEISVDNVVPIWAGLEGEHLDKEKNIYMGKIVPIEVCPYIFYHLTVHANGDVSTCFVDWDHKNILGNVNKETLYEIWNGEVLRRMRIDHLKGKKEGICAECPQLIYGQPDNLDAYAERILERLT